MRRKNLIMSCSMLEYLYIFLSFGANREERRERERGQKSVQLSTCKMLLNSPLLCVRDLLSFCNNMTQKVKERKREEREGAKGLLSGPHNIFLLALFCVHEEEEERRATHTQRESEKKEQKVFYYQISRSIKQRSSSSPSLSPPFRRLSLSLPVSLSLSI
jgi:hypothetical protein